jgi:hypothetical protein
MSWAGNGKDEMEEGADDWAAAKVFLSQLASNTALSRTLSQDTAESKAARLECLRSMLKLMCGREPNPEFLLEASRMISSRDAVLREMRVLTEREASQKAFLATLDRKRKRNYDDEARMVENVNLYRKTSGQINLTPSVPTGAKTLVLVQSTANMLHADFPRPLLRIMAQFLRPRDVARLAGTCKATHIAIKGTPMDLTLCEPPRLFAPRQLQRFAYSLTGVWLTTDADFINSFAVRARS